MPFKYPPASKSILEGNEFYRVTRQNFEGDSASIFGSFIGIDVGFNAIVVGPDSGFDNYIIYYPDPTVIGGIAIANFSVGAPFIATVAPNAAAKFDNTLGDVRKLAYIRPTQAILLSPTDLGGDFSIPWMDLIAYTGKLPPVLPSERSVLKKQGYFKTSADAGSSGHAIEGFGRKSFTAHLMNNSAADVTVVITGIMIGEGILDPEAPIGVAEKHILVASTAVASGSSLAFAHSAVADGYFDYYLLEATSVAPSLPSDGTATAVYISLEVQD